MSYTTFTVPDSAARYVKIEADGSLALQERAMLLYPAIANQTISHGRAAELLGIPKWDLIELYAGMGIPYLTQTREEVREDVRTIERVMKAEEIRVCVELLRSSGRYISESLLDSLLGQKR